MDLEEQQTEKKKKKKRKNRFWYYLYAIVILILTIANIVLFTLVLFHVQRIDIQGTKISRKNDVLEWIQEDPNTVNAIYAYCKFKMGAYELPPYLEGVQVKLRAPWALRVVVDEKDPIGCIVTDTDYVCFDQEGMVLIKENDVPDDVPMIEGVTVEEAKLYEKITINDEKFFSYIIELTETLKREKLKPDRIAYEEDSMNINIGEILIKLGHSRFEEKVIQLPPILEKLEGKKGVLDMEYYNETSKNISFMEENN